MKNWCSGRWIKGRVDVNARGGNGLQAVSIQKVGVCWIKGWMSTLRVAMLCRQYQLKDVAQQSTQCSHVMICGQINTVAS